MTFELLLLALLILGPVVFFGIIGWFLILALEVAGLAYAMYLWHSLSHLSHMIILCTPVALISSLFLFVAWGNNKGYAMSEDELRERAARQILLDAERAIASGNIDPVLRRES